MCVWIGGEGRGWLSDCWVSRSGMTHDGEDHTENYWHNYQDDLPNRCFLMTEPWRPHAARIHTVANTTTHLVRRQHSFFFFFLLAAFLCIQMLIWFKVFHKVCFFSSVHSGCARRMSVSSCSQVMAALAHFSRATEASDAFASAAHPISSHCSIGGFHSTGTRCQCAAKSGGSGGLRKRQNSSLFSVISRGLVCIRIFFLKRNKRFCQKYSEALQWETSGSSCRGIPTGLKIGHNTPYITSGTSRLFTVFRSEKRVLSGPEWLHVLVNPHMMLCRGHIWLCISHIGFELFYNELKRRRWRVLQPRVLNARCSLFYAWHFRFYPFFSTVGPSLWAVCFVMFMGLPSHFCSDVREQFGNMGRRRGFGRRQRAGSANRRRRCRLIDRHGSCTTRRPLWLCFILFLEQRQRHMLFFSRIGSVPGSGRTALPLLTWRS